MAATPGNAKARSKPETAAGSPSRAAPRQGARDPAPRSADVASSRPAPPTAKASPPRPMEPRTAAASPASRAGGLEGEIQELRGRVAALEARLGGIGPPPAWQPVPGPGAPPSMPGPMPAPMPGPLSPPPGPFLPPPRKARSAPSSGTWLALAGILVLSLGVVFFLKLAYDRGWVPLEGRFAIGVLGGLGLWALGDALRRRVDVRFAQALAAGGAVIAYVTVYIGYAAPAYREALGIGLAVELALLAAVALLVAAYALWRRWELVAVAAVPLATVLLAPAGDFSTAGVLYAVLLDTALLLAAAWRRWLAVAWVALAGANVAIAFGVAADVHWALLVGSSLAVNGAAVLATARGAANATQATTAQAGVSVALAALETGAALTQTDLAHPFAWSFLAFGALGLAIGALLRGRGAGAAIVGAVLLLAWPSLHFDGEAARVAAYAALGAAALSLAYAWPRPAVRLGARVAALPAWGFAVLLLAGDEVGLFGDRPAVALALAGVVALGAGTQWLLGRTERAWAVVAYVALAEALAAVVVALAHTLDGWAITVSWAAIGVALAVAAVAGRMADLRIACFAVFGLVLGRIFLLDIAALSVVGRVLAFLATGALLLLAAYLFARGRRGVPAWTPGTAGR